MPSAGERGRETYDDIEHCGELGEKKDFVSPLEEGIEQSVQ